jgi:hypothetical protein
MYSNSRWMRLHYQQDNVNDIKGKIANLALYKIAEILVKTRYYNQDKRFFVYIHCFENKIEGKFTKKEFLDACEKYLNINKRELKEYVEMNATSKPEAMLVLQKQFYEQFYGNTNK